MEKLRLVVHQTYTTYVDSANERTNKDFALDEKKRPTATTKLSRHDFFHAITTSTTAAAK